MAIRNRKTKKTSRRARTSKPVVKRERLAIKPMVNRKRLAIKPSQAAFESNAEAEVDEPAPETAKAEPIESAPAEAKPASVGPAVLISPIIDVPPHAEAQVPERPADKSAPPDRLVEPCSTYSTAESSAAENSNPIQPTEGAIAMPQEEPTPRLFSVDAFDEAFFSQAAVTEESAREQRQSFPPVTDDVKHWGLPPLSPEVLARRKKFRKVVGAVVAFGALFVAVGVGKTLLSAESASAAESAMMAAAEVAAAGAELEKLSAGKATLTRAASVEQPAQLEAKQSEVEASEAAEEPESEPAAENPVQVPRPEPPKVNSPRKKALALLNRGRMKEAIEMARAAIATEPDHALGYLYLGTALQETGKYKEGIAAYSDCARNAKKGPVWECWSLGGRK